MPKAYIEAIGDTFLDITINSQDYTAPVGSTLLYEILDQPNGTVISTGASPLPAGPFTAIISNFTPLVEITTYWWSLKFIGPSAEELYVWGGWFSTYSDVVHHDVDVEGPGGPDFNSCGDLIDTDTEDWVLYSYNDNGYSHTFRVPSTRGYGPA